MATNIANGDLLEMRVVCLMADQIGINVYHYVASNRVAVVGEATTADAAEQLSVNFAAVYPAIMPSAAQFYGCGVRRLEPTLTLEDGWAGEAVSSGNAVAPMPAQVAGITTYLTGLGGRSQRGRRYLPFPPTNLITASGLPDGAYISAAQAVADEFMAGATITGTGGTTVDLSPVLKHLDNTFDAITQYIVRAKWATQRSRGTYGRPNAAPSWPS